ncbi:Uncharacterised protein [Mycobacteroides abscessus subsp. abscessus]|uniref:hypothetical protein n=1 Tax=Mycobacteroides abscessus TaxID=36809 RepID=UPI0009288B13|nr:hypothetical protein [Mycobacteroides abscessus]MDM2351304.1 hypothetical protein [Mycobacteroides abscessus]MDM2361452.1 hypothetical protein [Mycobacteroides abscessus]QSN52503.1 hypothetical protein I3U39_01505 [Mycobacteroides abscessus subsp. abscessus]SIH26124.1 Uncharacterised protein [Mycobacteroides abscessus subsp. abscessus]SII60447.1 Uncharacterised protein [Mycobacteroides abscessus subsp. abscessus]
MQVEGVQWLGTPPLYFVADCLGRSFDMELADHRIRLTFPGVPAGADWSASWLGRSQTLDPVPWQLGPEYRLQSSRAVLMTQAFSWGHLSLTPGVTPYGTDLSTVSASLQKCHFLAEFPLAAGQYTPEHAGHLLEALNAWLFDLSQWVGLATTHDIDSLDWRSVSTSPFAEQVHRHMDDWRGDDDFASSGYYYRQGKLITATAFQWAITKATRGTPPEPWLLLRHARALFGQRQYRRAVIDACTATELALTALVDRWLADVGAGAAREVLLDGYQNVMGRTRLVKKLQADRGLARPVDKQRLQVRLATPRNHASHINKDIPRRVAKSALEVATEVVTDVFPEFSHAPSQFGGM